jgi:hypothetical protein
MRKLAFFAVSLALAGCQTMGLSSDAPSEPAAEQAQPAVTPGPKTPADPVASSGIVGMASETLRATWGEPSLKRTEAGAEMWQYGGRGNCTLLVYFYANGSNVMTVAHAEAVPGGSDEAALATCAKAAGKPPLKPIS